MDIRELGTVLSVWAHPDDETYLCAGLMSAAAAAGQRVMCVTATRGEKGSQDHRRWPPETMGSVREAELLACLDILGVKEHRWLDYVDGECVDVSDEEATAKIVDLFEQVRPDSVLTFGPEGMTDHADHKCVNRWVGAAFERAAAPGARLFHATLTPEWKANYYEAFQRANVFEGDTPPITPREQLAIDFPLEEDLLARKVEAIWAHTSQVDGMRRLFGDDVIRDAHAREHFVLAATK